MKTIPLIVLTLLSTSPALAHSAALPHDHGASSVVPVLIGCGAITLAALVHLMGRRSSAQGQSEG